MPEPVNFAVVGLKGIGKTHLRAIDQLPEVIRLVAVCDVLPDVAERVGEERGVAAFTRLEDLLARPDVEAVSFGTPHFLHAPQVIRALEAGKHALVEKPMARTARECDAMIDASRRANRRLGICHQGRSSPANMLARRLIDAGELGPILRILWTSNGLRTQAYYNSDAWRGRWDTEGGGVLINQTVHDLDLLCWLAGPPAEVSAQIARLSHETQVEDIACAAIRMRSGAQCSFQVSLTDAPGSSHRELAGDRATLFLGREPRLARPKQPVREFIATTPEPWGKLEVETEALTPEPVVPGGHAYIFQDFARAIREERQPLVTGEQARWAVELVNGIILSHALGRRVSLPVDRDAYDAVLDRLAREPLPLEELGG